jgi:predicted Zn-dependent protease
VKEQILNTLIELRSYALDKGYQIALTYHEEDSYLMRFANSAISLNTNEHLIRLNITAHAGSEGKKRASYSLVTDLENIDEMKAGIDAAAELANHSQPLHYQPTIPVYEETFVEESGYDPDLALITNQEKLDFINQAVGALENEDLRLSGIFSCGTNIHAQTNTRSEHAQFFKTSDAQITMVLAHAADKWEVISEQSAQKVEELDSAHLNRELTFLVEAYQQGNNQQLPLGEYDIVFGPAAIAEMISFMNWIGFNGGLMKRGYSFLKEDQIGKKVFSEKFSLFDDPEMLATFPFKKDFTGIPRTPRPIFERGVFQGFLWTQDDADEFSAGPTGHTVPHKSLVLKTGEMPVESLNDLIEMELASDILYIPFLHYMNIVNPSRGIVTATSRFGTLLLKTDGEVVTPYNVRITQSLLDVFGDKVDWLSRKQVAYNTSDSYGARNPTAVIVPRFIRVNNLTISHSNPSF